MVRLLIALAGLALLASPVAGQVGLASSAHTVVLTATRHGSVRVALPGGSSATVPGSLGYGPDDPAPLAVETAWDLDPAATSAVSLVAFFTEPGVVLFSRPITGGSATGTRTDRLVMRNDGWTAPSPGQYQGVLNLLAVTQ
jgi:hypothetical protein